MNTSKITNIFSRRTSVALRIDEQIVDEVISFQWREALKAIKTNNSVEISGMGRFDARIGKLVSKYNNIKKGIERLTKQLEEPNLSEGRIETINIKLKAFQEDIELLEQRLKEYEDKHKGDIRGLE